jgi:hypothetical protein
LRDGTGTKTTPQEERGCTNVSGKESGLEFAGPSAASSLTCLEAGLQPLAAVLRTAAFEASAK